VTGGACTIPLGVEPRHSDVLRQRPRAPDRPILDWPLLRRLALLTPLMAIGILGLFWYRYRTADLAHAQTIAFTTMVAFEWFQALNARSQYQSVFSIGLFSNRWLLLGVGVAIGLQVVVIQTPIGHSLFGTTPFSWHDWLWVVLVSSSIWIADELLKKLGVHGKPAPSVAPG
jgi:P-type Ca2+ transporter type 2C